MKRKAQPADDGCKMAKTNAMETYCLTQKDVRAVPPTVKPCQGWPDSNLSMVLLVQLEGLSVEEAPNPHRPKGPKQKLYQDKQVLTWLQARLQSLTSVLHASCSPKPAQAPVVAPRSLDADSAGDSWGCSQPRPVGQSNGPGDDRACELQLEAAAVAKWGSVEAFQAERQSRAEAQAKPSPSKPGDLRLSVCLFLPGCAGLAAPERAQNHVGVGVRL